MVGISLVVTIVEGPTYRATAEIVVVPSARAAVLGAAAATRPTDPIRVLGSEIELLTGPVVRSEVHRRLGTTPPISVSAVSGANIIRINAASESPARAAAIANAYASAYVAVRLAAATAAATAASRPIQAQITALQTQIDQATGQRRVGLIKAQAALQKELSQLQVGGAVQSAETRLLSAASAPASPIHPKQIRTVAWAIGVGLALGLAAAFYRDFLDDSIRSHEDLGAQWPDVAVVGLIPLPGRRSGRRPHMAPLYEVPSPAGEAYQALASVIRSLDLASNGCVLQVTSPTRGEGTTTVVANLGTVLAQQGRRVGIVCCDLRRPQVHDVFGLRNDTGYSSVITRKARLHDALRRVPDNPMLVALTAGPAPPNPSELLGSERAALILRSLSEELDVVLLDCPPVLGSTDSIVVSAYADATLLVCRAGVTTHHDLSQAIESLRLGGTAISGIVFNGEGETEQGRREPDKGSRRRRSEPRLPAGVS
jgi:receptor protein-tyrosine kinase